MSIFACIIGIALILLVLWDAFETVILPRRVTRRFRLTRAFYAATWGPWGRLASLASGKRRETLLSFFGPMSLLLLLVVWAAGLVLGFALIQWSLRLPINVGSVHGFPTYLYMSGTTFFTLGFGDVVPVSAAGRTLAVLESGTGFGFLALTLGYLPVLYQAFSRREAQITLLDARAGSPPTAGELLHRYSGDDSGDAIRELLHEWEHWSADLLESHLSYPVLAYFRSQHDNQSWLATLTTVLDTSAIVLVGCEGSSHRQARFTFAIARHAVVDLAQVFGVPPVERGGADRSTPEELARLDRALSQLRCSLPDRSRFEHELSRLRAMYEPYLEALADHLRLALPRWVPISPRADNWQTSAWKRVSSASPAEHEDEHS